MLPFGLTGEPASWQRFINDVLWEYFNKFCTAYLDNILIYSSNLKEHKKHVRLVLAKLREFRIQADMDKYELHVVETKYLGLIISIERIKIDSAKIEAIKQWDTPTCVWEVCSFVGFCNFYQQFIRNFLKIAGPLNTLTKKDTPFAWTSKCKNAFQELKQHVCEDQILAYFDLKKQYFVETNSSNYVNAGVLLQIDDDEMLHPVAYFSRRMAPAECNYKIYDKELLTIIRCFEEWRPELEDTGLPVKVLTDHKGFEYFMTTKKLNPKQVRWAKFLSEFNFVISYQSGKKNNKADVLMRKPNEQPTDDEDEGCKHSIRVLLPSNRVDHEAKLQPIEENDDKDHTDRIKSEADSDVSEEPASEEPLTLPEQIVKFNRNNKLCSKICLYLADPKGLDRPEAYLKSLRVENKLLMKRNQLWVADKGRLQLEVIKEIHDQPAVIHPGMERTLEMARCHYYWPGMKEMIQQFIRNCHVCKQAKAARDMYHSLLQPLPVPVQAWTDITMVFVMGLPKCEVYRQIYDAILMVINQLSKERHYIPCSEKNKRTSVEATADLFLWDIWSKHGLPISMTSDCGSQFVSKMWDSLCKLLRIKAKLSTAFYPETDGQSKNANQEAECYLRSYINHFQNNWVWLLPMEEFAANANVSASTKVPPFLATKGYNPRMSFDPVDLSADSMRERIANATVPQRDWLRIKWKRYGTSCVRKWQNHNLSRRL